MKCFICSKENCRVLHTIEEILTAKNREPTAEELREALRKIIENERSIRGLK